MCATVATRQGQTRRQECWLERNTTTAIAGGQGSLGAMCHRAGHRSFCFYTDRTETERYGWRGGVANPLAIILPGPLPCVARVEPRTEPYRESERNAPTNPNPSFVPLVPWLLRTGANSAANAKTNPIAGMMIPMYLRHQHTDDTTHVSVKHCMSGLPPPVSFSRPRVRIEIPLEITGLEEHAVDKTGHQHGK